MVGVVGVHLDTGMGMGPKWSELVFEDLSGIDCRNDYGVSVLRLIHLNP